MIEVWRFTGSRMLSETAERRAQKPWLSAPAVC
jgi:hypothetical protein